MRPHRHELSRQQHALHDPHQLHQAAQRAPQRAAPRGDGADGDVAQPLPPTGKAGPACQHSQRHRHQAAPRA
eukprot:495488-Pyramimonas_sp.AAC.1